MMREIKIGLMKSDPYWEGMLSQEGVPFEVVSKDLKNYSLLIVNQLLGAEKRVLVINYLGNGCLVLSSTIFFENRGDVKKVSSIVPTDNKLFKDISFLSLNSNTYPVKDETYENIENIVFSKEIGKGKLILLGFDLPEVLRNVSYSSAPIFTPSGPIFEILPNVSRNSVRKLIRNCLIELFNHANLPYVRLSNFPSGFKSVFVFRVDADNYAEKDFYETVRILSSNEIRTTYFINQSSYENNLQDLEKLKSYGFEIQSHMNKHCVYNSVKKNYENLTQSLEFLKRFNPNAFVAPFGIFNRSLLTTAEKLGMKYSSEFSYDYDNLPSFPVIDNRASKVLQIPIHPVCMESFIEAGYGDNDILKHFEYILEKAIRERMPIFLYGHPTEVFKDYNTYFQVFEQLMKKINKIKGLWKVTFSEFYDWWIGRLGFSYSVYFDGTNISVKWPKQFDVDLEIFYRGKFKVSKLKEKIDLKRMNKKPEVSVQNEREQYLKSSRNFLSKLKCGILIGYLNYKNMRKY